jgi:hexosaminidase
MSSNFPLLGRKSSPFEGGTRVAALLAGGLIPAALRSTDSFLLIHISDFYVTFATLAGVDPTDPYTDTNGMVHDVDGIDVWGALMARRTSVNTVTRQRWLPTTDSSLIFDDDSDPQQRRMWKYYGGEGSNDNGHGANRNNRFYKNGTNYEDPFNECIPDGKGGTVGPIVHTGLPREEAKPTSCAVCTAESPCLFEVIGDPMETTNLAKGSQVNASIQQLIKRMEAKLATYSVYMPGDMSAPQLACYRCLNSSEWNAHWQGWAGPCCLRKQLKTDDMLDSEDGVASLSPSLRVWPLPRSQECTVGGTPAALAAGWLVSTPVGPGGAKCASSVLGAALTRYRSILGGGSSAGALRTIKITVSSNSEVLGANTSYGYSISAAANSTVVVIEAKSPYGVAYALETLSQVLSANECTAFHVEDAPSFVHRGLMIDTGRRFYPVDFVERLLEGMAANKMNVLHMHLSEQCFRVQSATFPQLSAAPCLESATNSSNPGAYSQADIRRLVAYARDRGVRIIPEFDLPGHSGAFCTHLKSEGIECCGDQIQDDAAGKSVAVMGRLFEEMGQLFPDKEMHIGCDETKVVPPCTLANTKAFEVAMIRKLLSLGKQPAGWEEVLFTSEAAIGFPSVVVHSWHHTHWEQVVDLGHRAVVSNLEPFYLGDELPAAMWTDISDNVTNATKLASLLGGEVSAWSDEYLGGCMFSSSQDARFAHSVSNYIFPRTAVAAGSFWRWDHRVSTSSKAFAAALSGMQARLRDRGVASCPCTTTTSYNCSQNMLCDEPYCATGANYTCEDYGHGNASWSCHTGRVGLTVTHPINPDFTIPCTTLQDCLRVATWRCSTTFAARGCNAFSMTNNIDPTGGFGAVASFYALINGSTHQSSSDNLWIRNHVGDVLL